MLLLFTEPTPLRWRNRKYTVWGSLGHILGETTIKKVDVITWMFRATPMLTSLMRVVKLAECENDTVWRWAVEFRAEVAKLSNVNVTEPKIKRKLFWIKFTCRHDGSFYAFGLNKTKERFEDKRAKDVRQLEAFVKINDELLLNHNPSLEFFESLRAVYNCKLWVGD